MNPVSNNLSELRRLAASLNQSKNQASSIQGSGFDSLIQAALKKPGSGLINQVAELMILNSASRVGSVDSPSQSAPQFSASQPWQKGRQNLQLLQNLKPLNQQRGPLNPLRWKNQTPAGTSIPAKNTSSQNIQRQEIDALIQDSAKRYGLDPNLVRAVVTAESDFNPQTVSHAGAMGLMQLMPETASDMGVQNVFDPAQNIEGGTRYLALMLERFGGDESKALAAYNWGPSNVERGGRLPSETSTYLKRVARYKAMYAGGFQTRA
jgi:soluble lytic murein transglycosylase-like protein